MKKAFGNMILSTIELFGLSQKQAAYELGLTPQTLNHYIHAQRSIDFDTLCHIMKKLHMEPNYVFGWTTCQSSSILVSLEELQLIEYVRNLSLHDQQRLLHFLHKYDQ